MKRSFFFAFICYLFFAAGFSARADTIEDLKSKIEEWNRAITELEKEIGNYQDQIETIGSETKTLQNTIKSINLEQKKLSAEIRITETKISSVTLAIQKLSGEIVDKETRIGNNRDAIGQSIRGMNEAEENTLLETLLGNSTLSSFWAEADALERFQLQLKKDLAETMEMKGELEGKKEGNEQNRAKLVALKAELSDRTALLAQNKKAKSSLLSTTKSKESEYKKILANRVALRNAFEQELLEFESELKFAIDPSRLPETESGVLRWPLDSVKITQYFGNTSFAKAGGYNGQGHNGIDLRASIGTPIRAALNGIIKGVGNTDTVCPGASYGKWVLIEHQNGLSTLYAHFSLVKVSEGQSVNTGEIIGYSGDTGYATGPHLHFTVYATQGVRVMQRKSSVCKGVYTMPVADLKAYLNPLSYL